MNWSTFAWRNLWRNRRRTVLTMAMIGVAAFASSLALGYVIATFDAVREGSIDSGVGHVQVLHHGYLDLIGERPLQYGLTADEQAAATQAIAKVPGVATTARGIDFDGLVSNGDLSYGFVGEGIEPNREPPGFFDYHTVLSGRYLSPTNAGTEVVVGAELARKLGVHVGSVVQLMASTAHGGINATDAQIVGVMSTGNKDVDERIVNVTFTAAQALLRTDRASRIAVFLEDTAGTTAAAATLRTALPTLDVRTWDQLVSLYHQVVALYKNQFSVFGAILCATILLSMSNWILMSIVERRREISTLRALGVPAATVRGVLIQETALLGLLGAAAGIALALLTMVALNHAQIHLPAPPGRVKPILLEFAVSPVAVAAVEAAFVVLGVAAALLATIGLAKRNILEGLAP
ncbi:MULTISPECIES: ABC transporter permease [Burkholderia]|uniref:ABC transporter permease n=1 Tax=Burkholderia sola TaxID=2843302 RepID=A0ABV2C226_9BURK|nr:ABC transporter permease [Burkholderia sp. CpTa8-5]MBP0715432.1 ABC transporter permease [Burkholderia sp. AcTa6-5]